MKNLSDETKNYLRLAMLSHLSGKTVDSWHDIRVEDARLRLSLKEIRLADQIIEACLGEEQ